MSSDKNLDRYYTTAECRQLVRRARNAFYELVRDRDREDPFPEPVLLGAGQGGDYLFPREEVDAWLGRRPRGLLRKAEPRRTRTSSRAALDGAGSGTAATITTFPYEPRARGGRAAR